MDPTTLTQFLTVASFATVGGGVAFVWFFLKLLRLSLKETTALQTQGIQACLALVWGLLALTIYTEGDLRSRLASVVVNVILVLAIQTFGYEATKNVSIALGIGQGARVEPPPEPPTGTFTVTTVPPEDRSATQPSGFAAIENPKAGLTLRE